jgi:hypothetical protein
MGGGFETGGEMDNPFDDDEDDEGDDPDSELEVETSTDDVDDTSVSTDATASTTDRSGTQASDLSVPYIDEVDVSTAPSTTRLAEALMSPDYHDEDPPVPYSTWRDGTSTGRNRTTLELNQDVDALVRSAQAEFENRYGTNITKADLREFAMVYGLAHLDDVFEMAEEWGIQYDN